MKPILTAIRRVSSLGVLLWTGTLLLTETTGILQAADKPNVLFIAVDDLRPQLSVYGQSSMKTPNFDRLAQRCVLFERAYCMVPTCGASRASLMTSLRPTPQRFVSYTARADDEAPEAMTLNTQFKRNGYTTISIGKVFHFPNDSIEGWSERPWRPRGRQYQDAEAEAEAIAAHRARYPNRDKVRGMPYEAYDAPDNDYPDGKNTERAIGYLNRFAADNKDPFFLAVGFFKPHLPFNAPQKYWDLYNRSEIELPDNYELPTNVPPGATHNSGELRAYASIPPRGPVDEETAISLIHGYYACVSFIDAQLGKLLDTLDATGLSASTAIVLWGDHGWQLGEHGMWNKHSCFETSMWTPLFVSAPFNSEITPNSRANGLVEFIDIYPTLCELVGIPIPQHVEGTSFLPALKDPSVQTKTFAVGRFQSGDTIRSDNYRYSEYRTQRGAGDIQGAMLYDHTTDPNENNNIAGSEQAESVLERLSRKLNDIKGKD